MDNSGENNKFVERAASADWKLTHKNKFTSRNTPQQNGIVEVQFATIAGRGRAMCNHANIPEEVRIKIANEALSHSTSLGTLVVDKGQTKTRNERIGLSNPKWANTKIRTFGQAGVVTRGKNGKLGDRGIPMMFVGYPINHASDSYRMYNPKTSKISEVRDVIWLKRMYYQDNINADTAMLPEIRVDITELNALDQAIQAAAEAPIPY